MGSTARGFRVLAAAEVIPFPANMFLFFRLDSTPGQERTCDWKGTRMKRKKVVQLPEREENVLSGFFTIQVGDSRLVLDAEGNEKPPAEVRTLNRRKKARRRSKQKPAI